MEKVCVCPLRDQLLGWGGVNVNDYRGPKAACPIDTSFTIYPKPTQTHVRRGVLCFSRRPAAASAAAPSDAATAAAAAGVCVVLVAETMPRRVIAAPMLRPAVRRSPMPPLARASPRHACCRSVDAILFDGGGAAACGSGQGTRGGVRVSGQGRALDDDGYSAISARSEIDRLRASTHWRLDRSGTSLGRSMGACWCWKGLNREHARVWRAKGVGALLASDMSARPKSRASSWKAESEEEAEEKACGDRRVRALGFWGVWDATTACAARLASMPPSKSIDRSVDARASECCRHLCQSTPSVGDRLGLVVVGYTTPHSFADPDPAFRAPFPPHTPGLRQRQPDYRCHQPTRTRRQRPRGPRSRSPRP